MVLLASAGEGLAGAPAGPPWWDRVRLIPGLRADVAPGQAGGLDAGVLVAGLARS